MLKKVLRSLAFLFLIVVIWFSFFKTYDHQISFEVNVPQGTMYDILTSEIGWQKLNKELKIKDKDIFNSFLQELKINNKPFDLEWKFESKNDTNAIVKLNILNKENSLKERYLSLFKASENLDSLILISSVFKTKANSFATSIKIEINGQDTIPAQTYLYVNEQSMRENKAGKMIKSNGQLFAKNRDSLVTKTGNTFVYVQKWDLETDTIKFRYAFPIKSQKTYPVDEKVMVAEIPQTPALKATFYGNYSLSDQAWIALYNYAERQNIPIELTPIEIFYNNPMLGGDDRLWKAEVFMPIKKTSE
jgi:effector-binding domain-containing protein